MLNFDGTELCVLFRLSVSEALVDEGQNSDDNEYNADKFHSDPFIVAPEIDRSVQADMPLQMECHVRLSRPIFLIINELQYRTRISNDKSALLNIAFCIHCSIGFAKCRARYREQQAPSVKVEPFPSLSEEEL